MNENRMDLEIGERVSHGKFGDGTVADIQEGENGRAATVAFDYGAVKRILIDFGHLKKIEGRAEAAARNLLDTFAPPDPPSNRKGDGSIYCPNRELRLQPSIPSVHAGWR